MAANTRRIQKTLDRIIAEIDTWGQSLWGQVTSDQIRPWNDDKEFTKAPTCGAAYCMAGHAVIAAGHTPLLERGTAQIHTVALKGHLRATLAGEREPSYIPPVAMEWLGLSEEQGSRLFEASNGLPELYAYTFVWTGGGITIPDFYAEYTDGDGEWSPGTENLPEDVRDVLKRMERDPWPEEVAEPYMANREELLAVLDKQIERADRAKAARQDERELAHARHGA